MYLKHLREREIENPFEEQEEIKKWKYTLPEAMGEGYEIAFPSMPSGGNAHYEEWRIWFERHFEFIRDGLIIIGGSLGGYFIAKYLSENTVSFKIKALYLIAAPFENDKDFGDEDGGDFEFDTTLLENLEKQVGKVTIYHSTDDPIVPFSHGEKYAKALPKAEFVTFEDRGHFICEEFPEIIESLRSLAT